MNAIAPLSFLFYTAPSRAEKDSKAEAFTQNADCYENLQKIKPSYEGQQIYLESYYLNGFSGGGRFIAVKEKKTEDYGVTCVVNEHWCWLRIERTTLTPQMFGAISNGLSNDSPFIQRVVVYFDGLYSGVKRMPRGKIHFPAGTYCIGETICVRYGPLSWEGDGIWNTLFIPYTDKNKYDNSFLFKFENEHWISNASRALHEISFKNFSVNGMYHKRSAFYLGGCGWDGIIESVQIWGVGLSVFVCYDLMDTTFRDVRINLCGKYHNPDEPHGIYTHPIMLLSKFDCCNAIRFDSCHFEGNYTGVVFISGRANNIAFVNMCKFEGNGVGSIDGYSYSVIEINNSLADSIRFENIFVSHTAKIKQYFIRSNSRHLLLQGGTYMSPSDESGYTGLKWFYIHRSGWNKNTKCVGAIIDIDVLYVDGSDAVAPIFISNQSLITIKAVRLTRPHRFFQLDYSCKVNIYSLTVLDLESISDTGYLFDIGEHSLPISINVESISGNNKKIRWLNNKLVNKGANTITISTPKYSS